MQVATPLGVPLAYVHNGKEAGADTLQIIWAHGWGHSHQWLLPLTSSCESFASNIVVDFPGFGESPKPTSAWGVPEYADHIAEFLKTQPCKKRIWVGHSFGGRVGIELASRYPALVDGMFLIAAAGLPIKRSLCKRVYINTRIYTFKALKKLIPLGLNENWLRSKFGSADYRNAGDLRSVFLKVVSYSLFEAAKKVSCPTRLVYGARDTETPPEIGNGFAKLIPNSSLFLAEGFDHISILTEGKHQVLYQLKQFINERGFLA